MYRFHPSDKKGRWIILRNPIWNMLLTLKIYGQEFTDTPMLNSDIMEKLRLNKAEWARCDIEQFTEKRGGLGDHSLSAFSCQAHASKSPMAPPNWYLQTFPFNHPSICINCTYMNVIETVGNWHIGIFTGILLEFLVDPLTRPSPFWMKRWIDMTGLRKAASPAGPFEFFTYLELVWWLVFCVAFNPFRWKWALFVFFGLGYALPAWVVQT
ncbi:hypothetical protein QC764_122440 [Podospora pseudoanserina]|uniref:Uncharacterized protein n=1 Tax=Podospora pseudoanserina TaxID=2609844 RepID=A0ABR0IRW2_9PEZI|nr:hypothetical protein QC764_122440 [Podospora pseudoanserina]